MPFLEVPFFFRRFGIEPRLRAGSSRILVGTVLAELREIPGAEAPVAARCRYVSSVPSAGGGRLKWQPAEVEVDYRVAGSVLLRRAVPDGAFMGEAELPARFAADPAATAMLARLPLPEVRGDDAYATMRLLRQAMAAGAPGLLLPPPGARREYAGCRLEEHCNFVRDIRDDRQARSLEVRRLMAGAAMIDGVLYLPSYGPGWLPLRDRGPDTDVAAVPEMGWHCARSVLFRGDQRDTVEALAARHGGQAAFEGDIGVYDPAALPLPPEAVMLHGLVRDFETRDVLAYMGRTRNADGIRAYADMLDASVNGLAGTDGLISAFRRFRESRDGQAGRDDPMQWVAEAIDRVLAIADVRVELADGPAPRAGPTAGRA